MSQEPIVFELAESVPIKVAGIEYTLNLDVSAVLHAKVQRWFFNLADADEQKADLESIDMVTKVVDAPADVVAGWPPMIRKGLLAFLSNEMLGPRTAPKQQTSTT